MTTSNITFGQHDPDRAIVLDHWDGRSQYVYVYEDELALPDWQRAHIIIARVAS